MAAKMAELKIERSLLLAGERVCVAISGGADSVALLLALVEAKAALGVGVSAAHVHHGLRGMEADGDEAFVRGLCKRLDVPLTVFRVDTGARQAAEGEGVEEAARELRYAALRGLLENGAADVVATAHTLDDQAETVMMKLLRGAWTEGLGGISPEVQASSVAGAPTAGLSTALRSGRDGKFVGSVGRIVRPMLGVRRSEIEAFLRARGQDWRSDASNADVSLTRNRVRHELMPMLRSFNPAVDEMLANVAELARDEQAYWEAEVGRLLPHLLLPGKPVRGGGRAVGTAAGEAAVALELERLKGLSPALRRRVLRAAARSVGFRLSFEETAKLLALGGFGGYEGITGRVGSRLELRGGLRAERSARELRLWKAV
jgi:tRNA(Ile)-lysidine synthase